MAAFVSVTESALTTPTLIAIGALIDNIANALTINLPNFFTLSTPVFNIINYLIPSIFLIRLSVYHLTVTGLLQLNYYHESMSAISMFLIANNCWICDHCA